MPRSEYIQTDLRHCSVPPFLWTSIVFAGVREIDALIGALQTLRNRCDDPEAHFHLQSYGLNAASPPDQGEVIFHGPALKRSEAFGERDNDALKARQLLDAARGGKKLP